LKNYTASGNQPEKPTAPSKEGVLTAAGSLHRRADDARNKPSVRLTRAGSADMVGSDVLD
jgi:hypothetical protein